MAHVILGVDLGARSIKVAEMETGFRQLRLVALHEREVPAGSEPYSTRAATALRSLIVDRDLHDATLYAAMPGDQVSLRLLQLPFADAKKIEQVIGFELEGQILHDVGDIVHDHVVVDHTPQGGVRLLAAAARKDDVRAQLELLGSSGIEARELFAAPLVYSALADQFLGGELGAVAMVDVGATRANVCVLKGGKVVLARTISRGGDEVTASLARTYRLSEEEAERVKHDEAFAPHAGAGDLNPSQARMADLVRGTLAPLVRELRQTFALVRAELGQPVLKVYTCGGASRLTGLAEHLQEEMEVIVEPLVLTGGIGFETLPGTADESAVMSQALAVALTGATGRRDVDFRRGEFAYKADFSFLRAKAAYLGACLLAVMATIALNAYAALHQLRRDEAVLDQRLKAESTQLFGEAMSDPEAVSKRIARRISMEELPVPPATAYDVFDEISRAVPPADKVKLDITELEIKSKKVFIKGTTDSATSVDEIAAGLAKVKCFASDKGDAIQKGAVTNVVGQGDLKQFSLTITSKCP
jgi:general secretion pathway protein L